MKCSQDECYFEVVGRYTWPGKDESGICAAHLPKLLAVAEACGFELQVIPVPAGSECHHPPPEELRAIWCSVCGAFKPNAETPLVWIDEDGEEHATRQRGAT
jgi:hypothetical protein